MTAHTTTTHDVPTPTDPPTSWTAPRWVGTHPVLTALAVTGACAAVVATASGIGRLLDADTSLVRLVATLVLAGSTAVLLTRWRAWRAVGFNAPRHWRHLPLMLLPLIFVLWPFTTGLQITVVALLAAIVLEVPNSFCEEALFRGVLLRAFAGRPAWQAAVVSGVTFGALHFVVLLFGESIVDVAPLVVIASLFGIGYAALRIRTNTLWAPLVLHAGWNITQNATDPVGALGQGPATLILLLSALIFPVYGLILLRHRQVAA